jgi:hypothetical protein
MSKVNYDKQLPPTVVRKDGDLEFPSITCIYDFFSPRTKQIVNWCFGFRNGGFETEIAESSGSKLNIFDSRPGAKERYDIFERIMKTHETEERDPPWAEILADHWILPDSTKFSSVLPYEFSGTLDINGCLTSLNAIDVKTVPRIDICKVDYDEFTMNLVYFILNSGYRPGLFYINWPFHPDHSNTTMVCAGHLQTCGYRLLKAVDNYFVYLYIDDCMYNICSWEVTACNNPMFAEFHNGVVAGFQDFFKAYKEREVEDKKEEEKKEEEKKETNA